MNTVAFGSRIWDFLHHWPLSYPNEILNQQESMSVIKFLNQLFLIIPCIYCRESAKGFKEELNMWKLLTWKHPKTHKYFITKYKLQMVGIIFHNRVNTKLQIPISVKNTFEAFEIHNLTYKAWKLDSKKEWLNSFFVFLFTVCWNYPENENEIKKEQRDLYYDFFTNTIPGIISHLPISKSYKNALLTFPMNYEETLSSRQYLKQWIYNIRKFCHFYCSNYPENTFWTFQQVNIYIEGFRARAASCQLNIIKQEDKKKVSCQ